MPRAQQLRFHTQTAGSTLTAQQPDNNIVRVALQALAAVLGGTQSLHCNGRDEALALPTEESARIALRTQQIIAAESGVANTVDPVAGSYAIEAMTNEIERGAAGHPRSHRARRRNAGRDRDRPHPARDPGVRVPRAGGRRFRSVGRRRRQRLHGRRAGCADRDAANRRRRRAAADRTFARRSRRPQFERLVRGARPQSRWRRRSGSNLVPPIIEAVEARATVGEIADTMRAVFGEYQETSTV